MKRITICIDNAVLKECRKVQAEAQSNAELSVSLSNVVTSCCSVAVKQNKNLVKKEVLDNLTRE